MTTKKVSLSLDEKVIAEVRERAGERGVSAYVNHALELVLQRDRLGELLDQMDAESGPVPDEVMEEARREWPAPNRRPTTRSA